MALIDLKHTVFTVSDGSTPPNAVEIEVGAGSLEYTETRAVEFVKRRGELDTVREGEEEPMSVTFQFVWERLTALAGDPPTVEDVLKRRGHASAWQSTSPDPDAPFCVDLAITHTPPCGGVTAEVVRLEQFHYEELAHSVSDATVDCKGKCNRVAAN